MKIAGGKKRYGRKWDARWNFGDIKGRDDDLKIVSGGGGGSDYGMISSGRCRAESLVSYHVPCSDSDLDHFLNRTA